MSQNDKLLEYFKKGGKLTSRDALVWLGIYRLASRVNELRGKGLNIDSHYTETANGRRVKIYYLKAA